MLSVIRLAADEPGDDHIADEAVAALRVLAARPGYVRGSAARSTDDPSAWVLVTEWRDIGSYRRALGNYEVKLHAQPLLARALDSTSAYEVLIDAEPGAEPIKHSTDLDIDRLDGWPPTEMKPW